MANTLSQMCPSTLVHTFSCVSYIYLYIDDGNVIDRCHSASLTSINNIFSFFVLVRAFFIHQFALVIRSIWKTYRFSLRWQIVFVVPFSQKLHAIAILINDVVHKHKKTVNTSSANLHTFFFFSWTICVFFSYHFYLSAAPSVSLYFHSSVSSNSQSKSEFFSNLFLISIAECRIIL